MKFFLLLASILGSTPAVAADFDLAFAYGQSRDFWKTVNDVQDRTGDLQGIQSVLRDRYGHPDLVYSYLDAAYSYPREGGEGSLLSEILIGTRAEAVAGGEVSNPVSPMIRAYANSTGIASLGLRSSPSHPGSTYLDIRGFVGIGPEKRLFAQGAEFIEAIPVRSGSLYLGGIEGNLVDRSFIGNDFWITTDILVRPEYFHSSVKQAKSFMSEQNSFWAVRWRLQNEWLKEVNTFFSRRTQIGIVSILGQDPQPYLSLPVTWDYQQKLKLFPGLGSTSGIGPVVHLQTEDALPNFTMFGGFFGGALGGGINLQLGPVILSGATYGVENLLSPARESTRIWNATLGIAL